MPMIEDNNGDVYVVIATYDKPYNRTGVALYGAFHSKQEAKDFKKRTLYRIVGDMYQTYNKDVIKTKTDDLESMAECFHIKKIKGVYPCESLEIDVKGDDKL